MTSQLTQIRVHRQALREATIENTPLPSLEEGDILVRIDKLGFTANNITYAVIGDNIGYWKYFPAEDPYGHIPAWGYADIVESRCESLPVGERLWGFFPMASHVRLTPGHITDSGIVDIAPHRASLPELYNQYQRLSSAPEILHSLEDERCVFFPLFATSYTLYDWLCDNDYFGAESILIGSASSKTGFGLALLLHAHEGNKPNIIGLTSSHNVEFVKSLGCYDKVVSYEDVNTLDAKDTAGLIDMSGSSQLKRSVHEHFGDNIVVSSSVGVTHWESPREKQTLPGAKPQIFFAPGHIGKRAKEWGLDAYMKKAVDAWISLAKNIASHVTIDHKDNAEDALQTYFAMLENNIPPSQGIILSIKPKETT